MRTTLLVRRSALAGIPANGSTVTDEAGVAYYVADVEPAAAGYVNVVLRGGVQ